MITRVGCVLVVLFFLDCVLTAEVGSTTATAGHENEHPYTYYATLLHKNLSLTGKDATYKAEVPPMSIRTTTHPSPNAGGTDVQVQLRVFKVDSLDQSAGHLKMKCWFRLWWHDLRLSWNPADFGGITEIQVKDDGTVWLPDVQPYNSLEGIASTFDSSLIRLRSSGELMWSRPGLLELMCKFSGKAAWSDAPALAVPELGACTSAAAPGGSGRLDTARGRGRATRRPATAWAAQASRLLRWRLVDPQA